MEVAHSEYHKVGKQPILEMQRLTTANEAVVEIGQKGEDDDLIQYQIQRAEQGDLPSIEALGDLYYWGARGVPRDQTRALQYFTSALLAGSNNARCAAAVSRWHGGGLSDRLFAPSIDFIFFGVLSPIPCFHGR